MYRAVKLFASNSREPVYFYKFTYEGRYGFYRWSNDTAYSKLKKKIFTYFTYLLSIFYIGAEKVKKLFFRSVASRRLAVSVSREAILVSPLFGGWRTGSTYGRALHEHVVQFRDKRGTDSKERWQIQERFVGNVRPLENELSGDRSSFENENWILPRKDAHMGKIVPFALSKFESSETLNVSFLFLHFANFEIIMIKLYEQLLVKVALFLN